jgi:S1-C subfamily serine protease
MLEADRPGTIGDMDNSLDQFSNQLADAVARASQFVLQVQGRRRPVSGIVYDKEIVVTTARALGRGDRAAVRTGDGRVLEAEFAGWDPATHLVVLRAPGLDGSPAIRSTTPPRVGNLALAVARSWSNAVTASSGIVSIIGGPLPTGRHRSIEQVIRTNAPMHEGFSGGAFIDTAGQLIGLTTAAAIRGLGVVIPVDIVWKSAAGVLAGGSRRGYLGLVGQSVALPADQPGAGGRSQAILVTAVNADSPAHKAGIVVGDLLVEFAGQPVVSPEDLLALLGEARIDQDVTARVVRGGAETSLTVHVGERPAG